MMERATNNVLFKRIQTAAVANDIKITFTTQCFYIKILEYALSHGEENAEGNKTINLSIRKMATISNITLRMADNAIKILCTLGAIERTTVSTRLVNTTFPRDFYKE